MPRELGLLFAFVLLIRLPFLNMPVQGDDVYYLAQAQHAQVEPLHPANVKYIFQGVEVDMRGHPHPPLNSWFLGLLLAIFKDVYVGRFHLAYMAFSLIAAASVWSIAKKFTPHPLWAALLFLVTPAFVINGNSFETDVPFVAFWLASVALFLRGLDERRWLWLSIAPMSVAAMISYQAAVLPVVLWWLLWIKARQKRAGWVIACTPLFTIAAYQLWERSAAGSMPAGVLAGYLSAFQVLTTKLWNAAGLAVHFSWLVFPALWWFYLRERSKWKDAFLEGWIILYFAAALVLFYSGAARYLLPLAAPVAILVSRPGRWLRRSFAIYLMLGLALTFSNFSHWEGYRQFARELRSKTDGRVWVNGEWGLRHYLEADGALPVQQGQAIRPGEVIVSSKLAYPVAVTTGGGRMTPLAIKQVKSMIPLQLIGLHTRSGYSTVSKGLLPFGMSWAPIDEIEANIISRVDPSISSLKMNAPEASEQLVSGFFDLEENTWRWMSGQGIVLVKSPAEPRRVFATFYIPDSVPGRRVTIKLDNRVVAEQTYAGPGQYALESPSEHQGGTILVEIDKTLTPPGDHRQLGMIVTEIGFR